MGVVGRTQAANDRDEPETADDSLEPLEGEAEETEAAEAVQPTSAKTLYVYPHGQQRPHQRRSASALCTTSSRQADRHLSQDSQPSSDPGAAGRDAQERGAGLALRTSLAGTITTATAHNPGHDARYSPPEVSGRQGPFPPWPSGPDVMQYGFLYDVFTELVPAGGSTIIEVLDDKSCPKALRLGSRQLVVAHIRLERAVRHRQRTHVRQRSDELIEDLEHELSGIITEYLHVRVTYRHSGFPHQPIQKHRQGQHRRVVGGPATECEDGIAGIKTTIQTTAIGTIKRHNAASPWSQPLPPSSPEPGNSRFLEVIASHWGPDNAHAVMQRVIRSKQALAGPRIIRSPPLLSMASKRGDESDTDEIGQHHLGLPSHRHDKQDHVRRSNHKEELPLSQDDETDAKEEELSIEGLTPQPALKKRAGPFLPVPRRQASLSHLIERELAASRRESSPSSSEDIDRDGERATSVGGVDDDDDRGYNETIDGAGDDDKEVKVLENIHIKEDLEETNPQGTILRRDSSPISPLLSHPPPHSPHDHRQHSKTTTSRRKRVVSFFQPWSSSATTLAGAQSSGVIMDPPPLRVEDKNWVEGKEGKDEESVEDHCQGGGAGKRAGGAGGGGGGGGGGGVRRIASRSVSLRMKKGREKEKEKEKKQNILNDNIID
ncbi:hypothetical protein B0J18DRAFT_462429 [Chaetomium sp. MPI-SDFR-AT-0129]|nr:hypothetical protein B0J18DRAFT_462429 [Chaetomium sp. MPI-SDFR-AT-0129]